MRGLAFNVYPYPDHSVLVVTLRHYRPLVGRDLVLGSLRLGIGREDLAGLTSELAVRLVAIAILNALPTPVTTGGPGVAPGTPGRGHGVEHVAGQLRLDFPV